MSHSLGDFDPGANIQDKFSTFRPSTGATFTLAGTPAIAVYKDGSLVESTAGCTLTPDFDSRTGFNHYAVDTSADATFYAAGSFFTVVLTAGTIDGISVAGAVIARFTLRKNSALKPATAGQTLGVNASGEVVASALGAQAKLDVNAEVVDGINTDQYSTDVAAPGAATGMAEGIAYLVSAEQNQKVQSPTLYKRRNFANTADLGTAAVSLDVPTNTITRGKES